MSRVPNGSGSKKFRVTLSTQSVELLEQLASRGIYGRNAAEVGGRFIDEALQRLVQTPELTIPEGSSE
jgi:hypothetical protein